MTADLSQIFTSSCSTRRFKFMFPQDNISVIKLCLDGFVSQPSCFSVSHMFKNYFTRKKKNHTKEVLFSSTLGTHRQKERRMPSYTSCCTDCYHKVAEYPISLFYKGWHTLKRLKKKLGLSLLKQRRKFSWHFNDLDSMPLFKNRLLLRFQIQHPHSVTNRIYCL